MRQDHFIYVLTDVKMKNVQPLLLFFAGDSCLFSHCRLVWTNFSWRRTFHCTIGAGTFTSKSSFNRKSVQFVTIRVKNIYARTFVTFYFSLGSSIQCLLFVGIRSYSTQDSVCRRMEQMYLSIVEEYFSVLMNNTSPKSFSFDFICFKYCFWFGI